jgi:hypothetical protein
MVDTGTQTFAGAKTFNGNVLLGSSSRLDVASAGLLSIGTGTATSLSIGSSTSTNTSIFGSTSSLSLQSATTLVGGSSLSLQSTLGAISITAGVNGLSGKSISLTAGTGSGVGIGIGGNITLTAGDGSGSQPTSVGGSITLDSGVGTGSNGNVNIGNSGSTTGQAASVRIGNTSSSILLQGTNVNLSSTGVLQLAGALTADITTAAIVNSSSTYTSKQITIQPGAVSGSCTGTCGANGAALNLYGGYTGTGLGTGGSVNIAGGGGFGGGSVNLTVGTGYSNGSINIATNGNGWIFAGQNGGTQRVGIDNTSPSYVLDVGNSAVSGIVARFVNSTGSCTINPTTTSLSCSSDETLKKDITSYNPNTALNDLLGLTAVTYHWNSEDSSSDPTHTGFIAQQVQKILPDLVATDSDTGKLSLSYAGLTPYIVAGMQAQQQQINQTKSDVTLLQTAANIINGGAVNGDLSITGSMNVVGNLNATGPVTLSSSLTVNGDVTFLGNLTVQDVSVKNITINGHIITAGNTPTITPGSAAGTADTQNNILAPQVTIEGNDTAGTITITTGANTTAGTLASVTFSEAYSKAPVVIVSAKDSASAALNSFADSNGSQANFVIGSGNTVQANKTYKFNYWVSQ